MPSRKTAFQKIQDGTLDVMKAHPTQTRQFQNMKHLVFIPLQSYILSNRIRDVSISTVGLFDFFPGQLSWRLDKAEQNDAEKNHKTA